MKPQSLSKIDAKVEIDEEGYPVFGGLRIDDPELLEDLFQNIQRLRPDEPRSKIVTQMKKTANGRWAWIDAFDEPFVVQVVEQMDEWTFLLHCLGGCSFEVSWEEFFVDRWNRFHAYLGEHRIPSVLSRKAQAQLLNLLADKDSKELQSPSAYRSAELRNERSPQETEFWSESYESGPGWDLGQEHPFLRKNFELEGSSKPEWISSYEQSRSSDTAAFRLLVPGAGGGHDAHFLAETLSQSASPSWSVEALDFADEALEMFHTKYPKSRAHYKKVNVFEFLSAQADCSLDAVFEHTFLCAIDPEDRSRYLDQVHRVLKPGGCYFGLFFLLEHHGGPPFAITQWELRERLQKKFYIKEWERVVGISSEEIGGRVYKELWARFSKSELSTETT